MLLPCIVSLHSNFLELSHGSPGSVNFLLNVVAGVGGGRLLGFPWQELPLIWAFVKERIALNAFSLCNCWYPTAYWGTASLVNTSPFQEDRLNWVLGCLCSGWQKDALGTLYCSDSISVSALQQEIVELWRVSSECCGENQNSSDYPLHFQLSRIAISAEVQEMAHYGDNAGLMDIKKNLRRLHEMTAIGVMDNKEMAKDIKSMSETVSRTSLDISNIGARTDDLESNMHAMLGRIERIEENLEKFISMNQESKVKENNEADGQPMEEESVLQPKHMKGI